MELQKPHSVQPTAQATVVSDGTAAAHHPLITSLRTAETTSADHIDVADRRDDEPGLGRDFKYP